MVVLRTILLGFALAMFVDGAKGEDPSERAPAASDNSARTLLGAILGSDTQAKDQSQEEERLDPDRPHFPEATTAFGRGRSILEAGYTFTHKSASAGSHSFPEALLRVGMFSDWFEFRIGQNFLDDQQIVAGVPAGVRGPQDLYLGAKVALTQQAGVVPAIALIPQMTVPTGSRSMTAGRILPGLNADMSWELVKDRYGIEVLIANNQVMDDLGAVRHELATGFTNVFQITRQLELFVEWDAFYPNRGLASAGPRQYAMGGLVFFSNLNFAMDARLGVGLNGRSNDYLAGAGFAVRF